MSDVSKAGEALKALATSSTARTKMGRLRELLPQIEEAHAAGVPHTKILETLNEQGLELTPKAYSVMLHRAREQAAKGKKGVEPAVPAVTAPAVNPVGSTPKNDGIVAKPPVPAPAAAKKPGEPERFDWNKLQDDKPEW